MIDNFLWCSPVLRVLCLCCLFCWMHPLYSWMVRFSMWIPCQLILEWLILFLLVNNNWCTKETSMLLKPSLVQGPTNIKCDTEIEYYQLVFSHADNCSHMFVLLFSWSCLLKSIFIVCSTGLDGLPMFSSVMNLSHIWSHSKSVWRKPLHKFSFTIYHAHAHSARLVCINRQ